LQARPSAFANLGSLAAGRIQMLTVYVLMGLPGSGKTTWRNRFVAACYGAAHAVARDDVVEEVAAVHGITYREAWAIHSKAIDKEFRRR
jgi:predicted ATPase